MARLLPSTWLLPTLVGVFALACGGTADGVDGDSGSDGSATDGNSTGGASVDGQGGGDGTKEPDGGGGSAVDGEVDGEGGGPPATGGQGGSGGEQACCLAAAVCDPGDPEIASEADCPAGEVCYSNHVCCSTVWCVDRPEQTCTAFPSCPTGTTMRVDGCPQDVACTPVTVCSTTIYCVEDNPPSCGGGPMCPEGTHEVSGCPGEGDCSLISACGTEIYCLADPQVCDPDTEYNRKYLANGADACAELAFDCEEGTAPFQNECGCGCEQPEECPEWVDCMPTVDGGLDDLCGSSDCPFTTRAY